MEGGQGRIGIMYTAQWNEPTEKCRKNTAATIGAKHISRFHPPKSKVIEWKKDPSIFTEHFISTMSAALLAFHSTFYHYFWIRGRMPSTQLVNIPFWMNVACYATSVWLYWESLLKSMGWPNIAGDAAAAMYVDESTLQAAINDIPACIHNTHHGCLHDCTRFAISLSLALSGEPEECGPH